MDIRKLLIRTLTVGAVLVLARKVFAKTGSARPVRDSASYDAIDAYVEQERRRLNIPGVSLAIVAGDRIVHLRGFGRARPGGVTMRTSQTRTPDDCDLCRQATTNPDLGGGPNAGYPFHPPAFLASTGLGGRPTVIVEQPDQHRERHHSPGLRLPRH